MAYESVDRLQKTLADSVFHYATDQKKAAGRALGTLVEIITFHALRAWGFRDQVVIERPVPEFANPKIVHNVEFSLHPVRTRHNLTVSPVSLPLTATKIRRCAPFLRDIPVRKTELLDRYSVKRNAAILFENESRLLVANLDIVDQSGGELTICELASSPFAIVECKRVGVEEGMRKGPQAIEKAKQGAYVARTVSSLQKVRLRNGRFQGIMEGSDGNFEFGLYDDMLRKAIDVAPPSELSGFILSVGVVSNHGNWFTSDNQNKELQVLAQSYDWLLFLTDSGLSQFIDKLLLNPAAELLPAREAFLASYSGKSGSNRFTKVRMAIRADDALQDYFTRHEGEIEMWFNVISPHGGTLGLLQTDLRTLANKRWKEGK